MWMPPQTTRPPLRTAASAAGTSAPTGAKMIAASSGFGRRLVRAAGPVRAERAGESLAGRIAGLVKANTRRPCQRQTWAMMWAAAPKP